MATLTTGVQQIITYVGSTNFSFTGSSFATGTTKVTVFNSSGSPLAWRNGSTFNNLPGTNKDQISPGAGFLINPGGSITVDDNLFAVNRTITSGTGGSGFSSGFGA